MKILAALGVDRHRVLRTLVQNLLGQLIDLIARSTYFKRNVVAVGAANNLVTMVIIRNSRLRVMAAHVL